MNTVTKTFWQDIVYAIGVAASVCVLVLCGLYVHEGFTRMQHVAAPVSDWFQVESIFVEDGTTHQFGPVTMTREVFVPLHANWAVEAVDDHSGEIACRGSGSSIMTPEKPNSITMPLTEYIGNPACVLSAGDYHLRVYWFLSDESGTTKKAEEGSNVFEIFPRP